MKEHSTHQLFQPITRPLLRDEVRRQLLERITDGRIPAATRVYENDLARQLGVSRTPLHEAMVSLARDGLVQSFGRKGWVVAPLTDGDAAELYPVLGTLEALGVVTADTSALGSLEELRVLVMRLEQSTATVTERIAVEADWHALLLAQCPNRVLVDMLRPLAVRAARFEIACTALGWRPRKGELSSVVQCLERGDIRGASRFIEIHWRDRGNSIVEFIRTPEPSGEQRVA
ncbi:MAG TPA: GntR family transcriptional regulator [Vicinamibacteria bacterium]|nr:GntR family transcriptional regulator [Vicinamibacteria bacterium]